MTRLTLESSRERRQAAVDPLVLTLHGDHSYSLDTVRVFMRNNVSIGVLRVAIIVIMKIQAIFWETQQHLGSCFLARCSDDDQGPG